MTESRRVRSYKKVLVAMKKSKAGHLRGYVKLGGATYRLYPSPSNKPGVEGWIEVALIKGAARGGYARRSGSSSRGSYSRGGAAGGYRSRRTSGRRRGDYRR